MDDPTVFPLKDWKTTPDRFYPYSPDGAAVIIDNGSYQCRIGWDRDSEPSLIYRNVLARTRKEKTKESELQIGNDISNIEVVRFALKSPFDRNVVTQFEIQEMLLDYGFAHLGINTESSVQHPIVMTHPLVNPNMSQSLMNELLFECYCVPKVAYVIDAMASMHKNEQMERDCFIISFGHQTVHFIPIVNGKMSINDVRRLNLGGFQMIYYLQRILQLKYPGHLNNITFSRAEEMFNDHTRVSGDYLNDLRKWNDPDFYAKNVRKIQLPYVPVPKPPPPDPEMLKQRRQELAKRLVEINARKREEKLQEDENNLKVLLSARNLYELGYDEKANKTLSKIGVSPSDLETTITKTKARIDRVKNAKNKSKEDENQEEDSTSSSTSEPKKRREDMCENEKKEFDIWLKDIKDKRQEILDKRSARQLRKQQLAKRRTAASQERMRMISQLAKHSKKDDNFGMRDEDWDVYKKINKDVGDSDSDEEQEKLVEYEKVLKEHDPHFGVPEQQEIPHDSIEWYQLHLATEQIRVPEILFQPSIIGHEQAGISETIEFILKRFEPEVQDRLVNNIFLTGSIAKLPGLRERLNNDLRTMRPFKSKFRISIANNPTLDAWFGAKKLANENQDIYMTKADYEEKGSEYFKEHLLSNLYVPTPEKVDESDT